MTPGGHSGHAEPEHPLARRPERGRPPARLGPGRAAAYRQRRREPDARRSAAELAADPPEPGEPLGDPVTDPGVELAGEPGREPGSPARAGAADDDRRA